MFRVLFHLIAFSAFAWFVPVVHALDIHGFIQGNYTGRVTGDQTVRGSGDYLLLDDRLQLELSQKSKDGNAGAFFKSDFFYDGVADKNDILVREGYVNYRKDALDLRVGRQIATWGTGDLLFINDLFPKNYSALYSGKPTEYMRSPTDGAKLDISTNVLSAEIMVMPTFDAYEYPNPSRFHVFDPYASVSARTTEKPVKHLDDSELALRIYRYFGSTDVSFYAYNGFSKTPSARPDNAVSPGRITYFYPELSVYGFSISGNILNGIGNIEAGYNDSRRNRDGNDPNIENSRWKAMSGYKRDLGSDFTAGVQYYMEVMDNYSNYSKNLPAGIVRQRMITDYATLRLTKFYMYQTLKLSFFWMYSPADNDYFINPEVSYKLTDEFLFALGGNFFGGERNNTPFGQLKQDGNLYTYLRYQF